MAITTRDATLPAVYSQTLESLLLGPLWTPLHQLLPLTWERGDTFVAPPWQWISHATPAVAPACLFQFNDEPALRALGLFQEETDPARG